VEHLLHRLYGVDALGCVVVFVEITIACQKKMCSTTINWSVDPHSLLAA